MTLHIQRQGLPETLCGLTTEPESMTNDPSEADCARCQNVRTHMDYMQEQVLSLTIIQRNRHRSGKPYEWFGPDPEPREPGPKCGCLGCKVRFGMAR